MPYLSFLPELLLVAAVTLTMVISNLSRGKSGAMAFLLTLTALGGATYFAGVAVFSEETEIWEKMLSSDEYSRFFRLMVLFASLLIWIPSWKSLSGRKHGKQEFSLFYLTATLGFSLAMLSVNFIMLIVSLETASISIFALIASSKTNKLSVEAAIKYFLSSAFGLVIMLWGVSLLFGISGSFEFSSVRISMLDYANQEIKPFPLLAVLTILIGLGFKSCVFPFYLWVPDLNQGSNSTLGSYTSTIPIIAGMGILFRFVLDVLQHIKPEFGGLLGVLAIITMIAATATAIWQLNARRMLSFVAISQAGFILMGLASTYNTSQAQSVAAAMFYIPGFMLAISGAFIVLSDLERRGRDSSLKVFNGLARTNPVMAFTMVLFLFSLIGIPPTLGFLSKYQLFTQAYASGARFLLAGGVVTSLLSVIYALTIIKCMYVNSPEPSSNDSTFPGLLSVPLQVLKQSLTPSVTNLESIEVKDGSPRSQLDIGTYSTSLLALIIAAMLVTAILVWQPLYDLCLRCANAL